MDILFIINYNKIKWELFDENSSHNVKKYNINVFETISQQ